MAVKFNPFTGQLQIDEKGSGGGGAQYLDGEVATYNDLPLDGTAAADSAWLVRSASGTWLIGRKPAGIYIRTATAGVSRDADYTYAGIFPDVFADSAFTVYSAGDSTKTVQLSASGITTGTNRVLTVPDASGTIATTADFAAPPAIGNTTPNSGAFTTLTANNGTLTASAPVLDLSQTWNDSGTAFTAIKLDITNTASLSAAQGSSKYFEINVGGVPQVRFQRNFSTPVLYFGNSDTGIGSGSTTLNVYANGGAMASFGSGSGGMNLRSDSPYSWAASTSITSGNDLSLFRDAADTLAQRRSTNPQTFRLYNTFTDASNYERGFLRWSSNVLQIGTEAAGTGTARLIQITNGGTTAAIQVETNNEVTVRSRVYLTTGTRDVAFTGAGSIAFASTGTFSVRPWSGSACRINVGGDTSSFPALKRDSTTLQARLADDSAFTAIQGKLTTETAYTAGAPTATGYLVLYDSNGTAYKVPAEAL